MRSGRQLTLRRPGSCRICGCELPVGTSAWWDPASRTVTCLSCLSVAVPPIPVDPVDPGRAGASALRKYQQLHDAREQHAREKLGALGGFLSRVLTEPSSTRAWQQGGNGEVHVGQRLEKLLDGTGVLLLHDRRLPGHGEANIDHIAVGPGGITVIDTKTHRGKVRRDWHGGLFVERRTVLRIDDRDQTKLIASAEKQVKYVRRALARHIQDPLVEVAGALCLPNVAGLRVMSRIEINAILVDGPKRVAQLAARPGTLTPDTVQQLWRYLAGAFPQA